MKTVAEYSQSGAVKGREAVVDLAWALINSMEFLTGTERGDNT